MALATPTPLSSSPFVKRAEEVESPASVSTEDLLVAFAERFSAVHGKFVYCLDAAELAQNVGTLCQQKKWAKIFCAEESLQRFVPPELLHNDIAAGDAVVTGCDALLAKSGSLVLGSPKRVATLQASVLICVAHVSQLLKDANTWLANTGDAHKSLLPPLIALVTGPGASAGNEKTSANAYGPKEVYCFVVEGSLASYR